MSAISRAMALLTDTFEKHAGKDGQPNMSKAEVSDLLHAEFPQTGNNKEVVNDFFSMLDNDKDGSVDFKEFVTFVAAITVMSKQK
ncbi:protein S100-G-like [Limanda limanda]|uniref:protein S100-G-like n=1 Tax=Limanda limanda TaxID=27771 RepID=UPI0029C851E9|nr:protein S100-G-like [Limanda limanda]